VLRKNLVLARLPAIWAGFGASFSVSSDIRDPIHARHISGAESTGT